VNTHAPNLEVVLATWNGARYLPELLHSIRSQSLRPRRVLVRDDVSSDTTPNIIKEWASRWPGWLIELPSDSRLGCNGNFAALLQASQAPFVALADQDDRWDPDKLEILMGAMQSAAAAQPAGTPLLVHSDLRLMDCNGRPLATSFLRHQGLNPTSDSPNALTLQNVVTGCACLVNRDLIEMALPLPMAVVQHDHWLALVAACKGAIVYLNQPLLSYRLHRDNAVGAMGTRRAYLRERLHSLGGDQSPRQRLRRCLHQAQALNAHLGRQELTITAFQEAPPLQRMRMIATGQLKKSGLIRQLGLTLLLVRSIVKGL